jgi:folate-binding protein YgfZ
LQPTTSLAADNFQLDALAAGCGMFVWDNAAIVSHTGPDALDLLHRLTTKDLLSLEVGRSRRTALTFATGRVIDVFLVAHTSENELLLISDSSNYDRLISAIDYFTIIEDAELNERTRQSTRISLVGPKSIAAAEEVFGSKIDLDAVVQASLEDDLVELISDSSRGVEWVDIICQKDSSVQILESLVEVGVIAIDPTNFEHFRIDNAIPGSDREYGEHANPIEAGLLSLIDFDKGCYVGQEVIARLDAYDKVQRNIRVLKSSTSLTEGTKLLSGTKPAGVVTSASQMQTGSGEFLSLALVRMKFIEAGTEFDVDGVIATVR